MIDYSKELNQEQLAVVYMGDGPCLVLAGAGSGKTRTVTYRVAYLVEQGIKTENILLVTFTNKASREMLERVYSLQSTVYGLQKGEDVAKSEVRSPKSILPWAGTFHSIAYKTLKRYASVINYTEKFSVLDSEDSRSLIKLCSKEVFNSGVDKKNPSANVLQGIISFAKNADKTIEEVVDMRYPQWFGVIEQIKNVWTEYEKRKRQANSMDFDDLLINWLLLLQNEEVKNRFSDQFKYILVDEYQDTNKIQAEIIKKLASIHKNILVVGDDAQSIYSFRAANIENILNFEKEYPEAKIFKLETNYRSTKEILDVANDLISYNRKQYKKELKTVKTDGEKPQLRPQMDQSMEASFILEKIVELLDEGTSPKEIAVLFRASAHSQMLEMELTKAGIDYDYRGGMRFFERAHIKDVLSYLRIVNNLSDITAWNRVLLHEDGVGPSAVEKILDFINSLENIEELSSTKNVLGGKAQFGFENFLKIWDDMLTSDRIPAQMVEKILDSVYKDYLENEYLDYKDRKADIKQLITFAEKYEKLEEFLAEATLQEGHTVKNIETEVEQKKDKVILSTVHQAKGLEWENVFVINLSSGSFPSERALSETEGLEEERRLFYVAITRAKKNLFLTYPMVGGGWGDSLSGPSMFLSEIDNDLLDDKSLISESSTRFNDPISGVVYESEESAYIEKPTKIKPGSFLRSLD
ncbi:MAG: ATP-dependent helicase, partial [Candidatus Magasanikbacteria bacterium]|nr:ATP-dependent helicase [Candidatus Magasanikbacteria bacterium]